MPLAFLYMGANCLYIWLYYILQYRKKIVRQNLNNSFPQKSTQEINKIEKEFYKNFTDYFVETIKAFSLSQNEFDKRITLQNQELLIQLKNENKSVILMLGHNFNWEWLIGVTSYLPHHEKIAVFKTIKNDFFNNSMNFLRERFGAEAVSAKDIVLRILRTTTQNSIYLFVADQSPKIAKAEHYITFLNQKTAVFTGFDKIIRKKNLAVVYCELTKKKRGYYNLSLQQITPDSKEFREYEIIDKFFSKLENSIKNQPSNWLWSHKRWKKTRI